METLVQDARYAWRTLLKSPAFSSVAVLTLALSIGANTAIFTVINALLLKMLPVKAPQDLVVIGNPAVVSSRWHGTPRTEYFSYPLYREFRDKTSVFSGVIAAGTEDGIEVSASANSGASDVVDGRLVTGNYFSVLGLAPSAGRLLTESDETRDNANPIVVLSYGYWARRFALSPAIIGKDIRMNGHAYTVIGVAPQGFKGDVVGQQFAVFVPLTMQPAIMREDSIRNDPQVSWLSLIARLKPGISVAQAKADVNLVFRQALKGEFGARVPADDRDEIANEQINVVPGGAGLSGLRAEYRTPLLLLMGIVGLVLVIACVNVANLLLARARARGKEIAVRMAIGASQKRMLQQLLTESVLLALVGGMVGALMSVWGVRVLVTLFGSDAELLSLSPDVRVLSFTLAISLTTGILFGLVPAWTALKVQLSPTLKDAATPNLGRRYRFSWGKGLVAGQVALSLVVLFGAGLLVRSLQKLITQDLGYSRNHIVVVHPRASDAGYKGERMRGLAEELSRRLAPLPGVRGVSYSSLGLFSGGESSDKIAVPGFSSSRPEDYSAASDAVSAGYFSNMGIQILLGRGIGEQDTATSTRVAVINETMMKRFFHGENPVGRQFEIDADDAGQKGKPFTVIGVSKDAKDHREFLRSTVRPRFYFAFQQYPDPRHFILEIVTSGNPSAEFGSIRSAIKAVDSNLQIYSIHTVSELIDKSVGDQLALTRLSALFAGLALLLACVGLYGIMSYTVAGRIREIGIRVALGAQRQDVLGLVLREGMLLVGVGLVFGIPMSLAGSRLLGSFLFEMKSTDPISLFSVIVLLTVVAMAANLVPARRAAKVDPMMALRCE